MPGGAQISVQGPRQQAGGGVKVGIAGAGTGGALTARRRPRGAGCAAPATAPARRAAERALAAPSSGTVSVRDQAAEGTAHAHRQPSWTGCWAAASSEAAWC